VRNWHHKVCFAGILFFCAALAAPAFAQQQASLQTAYATQQERGRAGTKVQAQKGLD